VAGNEASQLLSSCERSAVHLEMRDGYSRTDPVFAGWSQGRRHGPADWAAWWGPWTGIVAAARSRGVIIRRARIVSEPVSEYILKTDASENATFCNIVSGGDHAHHVRRQGPQQRAEPSHRPFYKTDRDSWLVQGWAVTDSAALAEMNIPEGETVVEIPDRLVPFFRREG
jgi:uncharacterized protein DUF6879